MICRGSTGTVELRYVNTLLNATYSNFQGLLRSLFFLGGPGAGTAVIGEAPNVPRRCRASPAAMASSSAC
jgi:hypothetical protein